jgi:Ca2+-binding EF-hand superfamily protein
MSRGYSRRCGAHGTALWRWGAIVALLGPALCLAACASDDHPGRREGRRDDGDSAPPPARPALFVSPAGEPFRAGPGEPYPVAVWFRRADANGDGKLTRDEFVADAARFFQVLDVNHDGVIDGLELKAYETEVVPEISAERGGPGAGSDGGSTFRQQPGGGGGGGGGGSGRRRRGGGGGGMGQGAQQPGGGPGVGTPQAEGAAPYGLLAEREPVASADLDLTSRITLKNFEAKAAQRFTTLDVDGKGYLLLQELPKTQAQQGGRRGRGGGGQRPPGGG